MNLGQIKNKIKYYKSIGFVRDTFTMQIGAIISTALSIITSILLARILQPSLYGQYSLIFALAGLLGVFMDIGLGYGTTLLLAEAYAEKNKQKIKDLITYYIKYALIIYLIVGTLAIILAPQAAGYLYKNSQIGQYTRIILLATFMSTFYSLLVIVFQVVRKIKKLTYLENLNKFFYSLFALLPVLLNLGLLGLVFGHFFASILLFGLSIWIYKILSKNDDLLPSFGQIFSNIAKDKHSYFLKFGILIAIERSMGKFYTLIPMTILGMLVIDKEVGFYKLAFSYMTIPLILIGPISRLLTVQLPRDKTVSIQKLIVNFKKVTLYSGLISIILVIPFIILAPIMINIFYGESYAPAVRLTIPIAFCSIATGFTVGMTTIYRSLHRIKLAIKTQAVILLANIPIFYYLVKNLETMGAAIATAILNISAVIVFQIIIFNILKKEKLKFDADKIEIDSSSQVD